jgi:hypothetical protein
MTRADLDKFAQIITTPADNCKFLPRDCQATVPASRFQSVAQ